MVETSLFLIIRMNQQSTENHFTFFKRVKFSHELISCESLQYIVLCRAFTGMIRLDAFLIQRGFATCKVIFKVSRTLTILALLSLIERVSISNPSDIRCDK